MNHSDLSSLREKSNLHELNKSKTLTDLENNIQKRLEFLDITEQPKEEIEKKSENEILKIRVENILPDETAEVLKDLSAEEDDLEEVELIQSHTDKESPEQQIQDPQIDYFKLIDEKLGEMKKKRIELLTCANQNRKLQNFKKSYSAVSWEISPNNSKISKAKKTAAPKAESTLSYEITFDQENDEILKSLKQTVQIEPLGASNKLNQLNELKDLVNNPVRTLIRQTEKNKENVSNEASTQTSFAQSNAQKKSFKIVRKNLH